MKRHLSRRDFVKSSLIASAALPLLVKPSESAVARDAATPSVAEDMPMGKIAGQEFSRLMMGGNLLAGHSHSRELRYVSSLMRRYNTPAKIRETLELGESNGINAINSWVMDDNTQIFDHWKNGGRMKWFAQTRLDGSGGFSQIQQAIDSGATGVHLTGDTCEGLVDANKVQTIVDSVQLIRAQKRIAGVAAHDLRVIVECEKLKLDVDFYQKTLHSHDYFTAPKQGETAALGANDNSWCSDPQAVIDVFAKVDKPFIAFKILAAGAIPPARAFPYAFNNGADFILVGMFDWQIEDDVQLAKKVVRIVSGPNSKRTRPWYPQGPAKV